MVPEFDPDQADLSYLYVAFADYLTARINDGTHPPRARMLGERDLAAEHGVSVGTVRRATELLRERGLVVTLPAKGTYVARSTMPGEGAHRPTTGRRGRGDDD
ncbi:winged helix-turn-helix domain-containing protein [Phytoactinopolyspora limicola]|uniref:winged helix-turn-helix domain-containing protein n=1 Tax=Phytoactinopolyspora limicola TaxID=2715536 RepID=UPI00140A90AC|nr:winged helix-turn-helix domain-containing protein [Phytoactinopolyspora limicola]